MHKTVLKTTLARHFLRDTGHSPGMGNTNSPFPRHASALFFLYPVRATPTENNSECRGYRAGGGKFDQPKLTAASALQVQIN